MLQLLPRSGDNNAHKIVNINLKGIKEAIGGCHRRGGREGAKLLVPHYMLNEFVMGKTPHRGIAIVGCDVPHGFCCRTDIRRGFHSPHLQGSWDGKSAWLSVLLRGNVCKVVFFASLSILPPETILDLPFHHKDLTVIIGLGRGMNDVGKGVAQIGQGLLLGPF